MKQSRAVPAMLVAGMALMIAGSLSAQDSGTGTTAAVTAALPSGPAAPEAAADSGNPVALPIPAPEQQKEELVTVDFVDTELAEIVKMFTRLPGVNIVVGTNITGKVTARLQNVPWKTALDTILKDKNLRLEDSEGSGVYSIVPRTGEDPLVTETIFLKYAEVINVIAVLKNSLGPKGKISDFSSRNAMVIQSTKSNLSEIRTIVEQIDIPRRQVFIEAQFAELTSTEQSNIGVGWGMLKKFELGYNTSLLQTEETLTDDSLRTAGLTKNDRSESADAKQTFYDVKGAALSPSDRARRLDRADKAVFEANDEQLTSQARLFSDTRTAVLSPLQFNLVLSALKSRDGLTILSKPKIIVANGEQALIHVGEERRPFSARVTDATATAPAVTTYLPGEPVQFGVKILVTPTINTDSNITVVIEPELTDPAGDDTSPDGKLSYPKKSTKRIKTQFTLQNLRTAAIGGLTTTRDEKVDQKVPLLSDVPLVGKYLFSHEATERIQRELIIFVTVGIVAPEGADQNTGVPTDGELVPPYQVKNAAERERLQADLERKQHDADKRTERAEKRKKLILNRIR